MKHTQTAHYPAPAAVVIKMFTDPAFHEKKLGNLGIEFEIIEQSTEGAQARFKMRRFVPMNATGIAAKVLPKTTEVVHEERWDTDKLTGQVDVSPRGTPLQMSCTARMQDTDDGCQIVYDWEIKAKLPIGASALEKFIAGDMEVKADEERLVSIPLLDEYR